MKLISLNTERDLHDDQVKTFLTAEAPDAIALMEAMPDMATWLQDGGYHTTFAPFAAKPTADGAASAPESILFASREPHEAATFYYHHENGVDTYPVIFATVSNYRIATTHFPATDHGETPSDGQIANLEVLLGFLATKPAHVFCGDLNIPRHINVLYDDLIAQYTDVVPPEYKSSIDPELHRSRNDPSKHHLFDSFMVDHLLTQPPYRATDTRLVFDISDHAAVVTTLSRQDDY